MNTTKHTAGPWHIGMKPGPMIYGTRGEQVADMTSPMLLRDEHVANARLIAAAPELLEALVKVANICPARNVFKFNVEIGHELREITDDIRTAIAKAKGQNV